ncbi:ADP-ribose diphosphatase [Alicyclobacillus contaminans]|uniref:NUDIX domain-containing protein n=1 Tax=Alicyclobacillus contaminans TaxID=392016 RepID=UPI000409283E|nr:NUDIX hydrolase [Alicyclobacillus contaminans]GMA52454.1 ADP-ribose diphosphatase [Alicyclobacillus contaminans]
MSDTPSLKERTVSTERIFSGKIVTLEKLTVMLPNGKTATREVIRHPGAVAVLAEPDPGRVVMVRQYRKALDECLLEIPAGKLEPGEQPEACAVRELREETGLEADTVEPVHTFYTSPGFADEKIWLFYTNRVAQGAQALDEDEFVDIEVLSRAEVQSLLSGGRIQDAKTLVALLWWLGRATR